MLSCGRWTSHCGTIGSGKITLQVALFVTIAVTCAVSSCDSGETLRSSLEDTLQVTAIEYCSAIATDNPDVDLQDILARIDRASLAECWVAADGSYSDPWGQAILVDVSIDGQVATVTCCSIGPDGESATSDDVCATYASTP